MKWNFTQLYKGIDDIKLEEDTQKKIKSVEKFVQKWQTNTSYLVEAKDLAEALSDYQSLNGSFNSASWYLKYLLCTQLNNDKLLSKLSKLQEIDTENENKLLFFIKSLSKIDKKTQVAFLANPLLSKFKNFLKKCFLNGKYILDDKVEQAIASLYPARKGNWRQMVSMLLSTKVLHVLNEKGAVEDTNLSQAIGLFKSSQSQIQKSAFNEVNNLFNEYKDVATFELNSCFQGDKVVADLKGYKSYDEGINIYNDVSSKTINTMIDVVTSRFDISRRYYALKAKLFGQKKLFYYQRNAQPLGFTNKFTWNKSIQILDKVTSSIHPDFNEVLKKIIEQERVDVYPNAGKRGGAFCSLAYSKNCYSLILLNHTNDIGSLITFAHELGHCINTELTFKDQEVLNTNIGLFVAETASTFIEDFALDAVEKDLELNEEKLALILERLDNYMSSVFTQTAGHNFQRELHEEFNKNGFLSSDKIGELFNTHLLSYMGDSVDLSNGVKNWWVNWHHIRDYPLYSYVSGMLIGMGMKKMFKNGELSNSKIRQWYGLGSVLSPEAGFKLLGIDINDKEFWLSGLLEIERLLEEAERLCRLCRL